MGTKEIDARGYANPDVLVATSWVSDNLANPSIRLVESNEDQLLYASGHLPGAVEVDWVRDLNDPVRRDYLQRDGFSELASRIGITPETTVVFYGDKNNWWACYAFWVFQLFGHANAKIMDGGRLKWQAEGREFTREKPEVRPTQYRAEERNDLSNRAFRDDVLRHIEECGALVDVRSPEEFTGERLHMPGYPNEGALRGGHIPGAANIPWARAVDPETGEFKSARELEDIFQKQHQITPDKDIITYCRIGERSSLTWFVLKYLLGYQAVKNYDGSWTEWGNLVGVPIEK